MKKIPFIVVLLLAIPFQARAATCPSEAAWIQTNAVICEDFNDGDWTDWSGDNYACGKKIPGTCRLGIIPTDKLCHKKLTVFVSF